MLRDFESADGETRDSVDRYLREMFGVVGTLDGHSLWSCRGALWVAPRGSAPPPLDGLQTYGLLVARSAPPRGQLSAAFIRRFCSSASLRVVHLAGDAGVQFLGGHAIEGWSDSWADGPRLVAVDGHLHGRGRVRDGRLKCELPKQLRVAMLG